MNTYWGFFGLFRLVVTRGQQVMNLLIVDLEETDFNMDLHLFIKEHNMFVSESQMFIGGDTLFI